MSIVVNKSKDRVIHLGSKSPKSKNATQYQNNMAFLHSDRSFNNSYIPSQLARNDQVKENQPIIINKQNQPNNSSFKKIIPTQKTFKDKSIEKVRIIRKISPSKKILLPQNNQPIELQNKPMVVQKNQMQNEIIRKNKILEQRIFELHQQRQNCVLKLHQQNQKLTMDKLQLNLKINHLENQQRDFQLFKRQMAEKKHLSTALKTKVRNSLKNDIYTEKQNEAPITSIIDHELPENKNHNMISVQKINSSQTTEKSLQVAFDTREQMQSLKQSYQQSILQVKQLENENTSYRIKEQKIKNQFHQQILQAQTCIKNLKEENNFLKGQKENINQILTKMQQEKQQYLSTIDSLNLKNNQLLVELDQFKKTILQNSKKISQNNEELINSYNNQLTLLKQDIKSLEETVSSLNIQCMADRTQKQQIYQENKTFRQEISIIKNELERSERQRAYKQEENATLVEHLKDLQGKFLVCSRKEDKEVQVGNQGSMSDCTRCKDLLKTFTKLNCKTSQK